MSLCEKCNWAGLLFTSPHYGDRVECIEPGKVKEIKSRWFGFECASVVQPQVDECEVFKKVGEA